MLSWLRRTERTPPRKPTCQQRAPPCPTGSSGSPGWSSPSGLPRSPWTCSPAERWRGCSRRLRMATVAEGTGAAADAALEVTLGNLQATVERMDRRLQRLDNLWQNLRVVPVVFQPLIANGTTDLPDRMGPKDGFWWDLRFLSSWGWTAGTVTVNKNDPNGAVLAQFPSAGQFTWSGQVWLAPRDRLLLTVTGLTGTVQCEGFAIEVSTQILPDYLL